ncbi:uncharacterized protein TNCV_237891 [Trichonephila clavipes]|nr:uncharacterized protein TNCV_237891 [Trichonephila clavipes]
MFDPSSFVNPSPLAHADASRDVLPRGGTPQGRWRYDRSEVLRFSFQPRSPMSMIRTWYPLIRKHAPLYKSVNSCPEAATGFFRYRHTRNKTVSEAKTELLTRICKRSDIPEFARQIALEIIHGIPHSALKIYTDGSMGDGGISGSSMHFKTPDGTFDIEIRNNSCCSVFQSEFIAIYKGLQFINTASDRVLRDI